MNPTDHSIKLPQVTINCDMGEGIGNDKDLMPYIHCANIACGYHAGDEKTMWQTVELALKNKVAIGAHVSFLDRKNFGRTEFDLTAAEIYELVQQQLILLNEVVDSFDSIIKHVKPHGALYNMSARNNEIAAAIADAVKDYDSGLVLFGLSGSCSIKKAKAVGLLTANEVFADRTYQDDGSLTPRTHANALIDDTEKAVEQAQRLVRDGCVTSVNGKKIIVEAETICIHGDGKHAVAFAKAIHGVLNK
jgi:UPF0271 protein